MILFGTGCGDGLGPDEQRHRLLIHCGLSFPMRYDGENWLPTEPELREGINAPRGFSSSDDYFDEGIVRRLDQDTVIYTSSRGIEVEYQATDRKRGGCE